MTAFLSVGLSCFLLTMQAWADRPTLRWTQGGRASLRSKDEIPSEVFENLDLELAPKESWWRVAPYVEARRDLDVSKWSHLELGAEAGVKPFAWIPEDCAVYLKPLRWFHVEHGFYERWFSTESSFLEKNHSHEKTLQLFPEKPHPEWKIRSMFDIPLPWDHRFSNPFGLYALNEYIYDLQEGRGIRNEVGVGIKIPLPWDHVSTRLGWRHVDLIHLPDVDQFEGSIQAEF